MSNEYLVRRCHWGFCVHHVDPNTNKIDSGFGPMMCPCDHVKGWRSPYVEGQARPLAPVKARGRHGSRVQRAQARRSLSRSFAEAFGPWLDGKNLW